MYFCPLKWRVYSVHTYVCFYASRIQGVAEILHFAEPGFAHS